MGRKFGFSTIILILGLVTKISASDDWLVGPWQGAFVRDGSSQSIELEIARAGDGLAATYSIPELSLYEQPVTEFTYTDTLVNMRFIYGRFELLPHPNIGQLTGMNPKWGPPVRLHLKTKGQLSEPWYAKREIRVANDGVDLAGMLYMPSGEGPFPAVVVVHGGGDSTRAGWEYRSHAYALTQRGIAAFLYDQRGRGASGGGREATLHELADDATACLAAVRRQPGIRADRVGLYGVSRGGWVATIVAARSDAADYLVLFEGPALGVVAQELDGLARTMKSQDYTESQIDSAMAQARLYFGLVDGEVAFADYRRRTASEENIGWSEFAHFAVSENDGDLAWWRRNDYDPAADLARIRRPVMAAFGENDTRVAPESNLALMDSLVKSTGQPFRAIVIPGLGHAVATYQTLRGGKWEWPAAFWVWSFRPPELDAEIARWIKEL